MEAPGGLWHNGLMQGRATHAGGFFLVAAIIAGFSWGALSGVPVFGAVAGTVVGIVLAVIVWLVDRRRR